MAKTKKAAAKARRKPAVKRVQTSAVDQVHALIHELQVHAEEITVQNEQLLKAQSELEDARDRFADLYDFAPTGYLSIDYRGVIVEINLAGASLFGRPRAFLINLPLSAVIAREDREKLQVFLTQAQHADEDAPGSIDVTTKGNGQRVIRLFAQPRVLDGRKQLFTAMLDVTEERRLQEERRVAFTREQARTAELGKEVAERIVAEGRVKALLERLVTAQEEERRRIARNLHDHLGQQLTVLRLTLSPLRDDNSIPESLRDRIAAADELVSRLDRDIDLLAWGLRPVALDDLGLEAALAELVRQWAALTRIPAEFHQSTPFESALPPEAGSNLYRIVQEALNNIAKHAGASEVSVLLEQRSGETVVIIEDDGRGFDPDRASAAQGSHGGMGLIGMRERAALLDGTVQIESAPQQGTTIFVRVPIKPVEGSG